MVSVEELLTTKEPDIDFRVNTSGGQKHDFKWNECYVVLCDGKVGKIVKYFIFCLCLLVPKWTDTNIKNNWRHVKKTGAGQPNHMTRASVTAVTSKVTAASELSFVSKSTQLDLLTSTICAMTLLIKVKNNLLSSSPGCVPPPRHKNRNCCDPPPPHSPPV